MAGKIVFLFPRETTKMHVLLAKSTWSWLFPILSGACEIKHSSAWEEYLARGEAVHSLCSICCVDVLQLPYVGNLRMHRNVSSMEHFFWFFFFFFFQFIQRGKLLLQADYTPRYCQLLQWLPGLVSHAGSLFFHPLVSGAATSTPLGRSGDNLALAPLPLAVLSGVLHVVVISSKLEVVLLPRDVPGVSYKEIVLLKAWIKNLSGNTVKRAKKEMAHPKSNESKN